MLLAVSKEIGKHAIKTSLHIDCEGNPYVYGRMDETTTKNESLASDHI